MGAGGGKSSTSSQSTNSPWADVLGRIGQQQWRMAKPALSAYSGQAAEALKTGGVNANIPSINSAVDASRQSSSQSETQMREQLARSGLAGTPFAETIMSQQQGADSARTGAIPAEAAQSFIGQAIPQLEGQAGRAAGAISGAGGLQNTQTGTSTPSFWDFFSQGLQAGGSVGTGLGGYGLGFTPFAGA
jgi:hypothetical protein